MVNDFHSKSRVLFLLAVEHGDHSLGEQLEADFRVEQTLSDRFQNTYSQLIRR